MKKRRGKFGTVLPTKQIGAQNIVKNTEYGHEIMKRLNEENSDFENETCTDMIDVLEDDEIVIDDG